MKISNVSAIIAAIGLSAVVLAQGPMGGPPGGGRGGRGGGMMGMGRRMDPKQQADRMTQMMTQMLSLTPAQQAKVKAIALKAAMDTKKIRDAQEAAIKKVLTPDQQKKLASMAAGGRPGGPGMGRPGMGGPGGMRRGG